MSLNISEEIKDKVFALSKDKVAIRDIKSQLGLEKYTYNQIKGIIRYRAKKASVPPYPTSSKPKVKQAIPPKEVPPKKEEIKPTKPQEIQPKPGGEHMALTKEDLEQISGHLSGIIASTLKNMKDEEAQTEAQKSKEQTLSEALNTVKTLSEKVASHEIKLTEAEKQVKSVCEEFPGLCKQVKEIKEKMEAEPHKHSVKTEDLHIEGLFNTEHKTMEALKACPTCKPHLAEAIAGICGDDETCKLISGELIKKGYKVEAPTEGKTDEKPEEKTKSGFSLGKGSAA